MIAERPSWGSLVGQVSLASVEDARAAFDSISSAVETKCIIHVSEAANWCRVVGEVGGTGPRRDSFSRPAHLESLSLYPRNSGACMQVSSFSSGIIGGDRANTHAETAVRRVSLLWGRGSFLPVQTLLLSITGAVKLPCTSWRPLPSRYPVWEWTGPATSCRPFLTPWAPSMAYAAMRLPRGPGAWPLRPPRATQRGASSNPPAST